VTLLTVLQSWRLAHFGVTDSTGIAADSADADGDGIANLIEYATGTDPVRTLDAIPLRLGSATDETGTYLTLTFNRIADPALTYVVECSTTLRDWEPTPVWTSSGADNTAGVITVTDIVSSTGPMRRFLRLRVCY
jgi:hypothetical protein